ncbi:MAG: PHP domain-containing protein [Eubacterium sp.]|nr:PHP domain-containing protein [Eubacterium sp.]
MAYKPNFLCDLHSHTTRSDGNDTPKEFLDTAADLGMKVVAITDHDVLPPEKIEVNGIMVDAEYYAETKGMKLLRGIEFSCETEVEDVHLVAFGFDCNSPEIRAMNRIIVQSKIDSYRALTELLTQKGFPISWEEVLNYNNIPRKPEDVQKKIIFNLMAEKGYTETWSDAKLMIRNTPEYSIKREKPDPLTIIDIVHRAGGIVILAHPYLIDERIKTKSLDCTRAEYIDRLIKGGLDGIEASYTYDKTTYNGSMTKEEIIDQVRKDYTDRVKIISGGSDYHADYKKSSKKVRNIGECGVTPEYFYNNALLSSL